MEQNLSLERDEVIDINQLSFAGEPMLTIGQNKVWVNAVCLKALPDTRYIMFLLNREARRVTLKPGSEEEQHAVRWKTPSEKPRRISCNDFLQDVGALMGWDMEKRRRLPGRVARDNDGPVIAFELARNVPMTLEEHRQNPLIKRLEDDLHETL